MSDLLPASPSSSSSPSPPVPGDGEYRLKLNNLLQPRVEKGRYKWVVSRDGPDNRPNWHAVFKLDGEVYGSAEGGQKKFAKEEAARMAYQRLLSEPEPSSNTS